MVFFSHSRKVQNPRGWIEFFFQFHEKQEIQHARVGERTENFAMPHSDCVFIFIRARIKKQNPEKRVEKLGKRNEYIARVEYFQK